MGKALRRKAIIIYYITLIGISSSCHNESKERFMKEFETFISDVDTGAKNYSNADWQTADEQFAEYKDNQFPKWEDLMTPDEKDKVNKIIVKYQAIQVKREIKDVKNQIENAIDQTKQIYKEVIEDTTITE